MVFQNLCVLVLWMKVATVLEGFIKNPEKHMSKSHSNNLYLPNAVLIPNVIRVVETNTCLFSAWSYCIFD